jgi:hypothetical protein
MIDAQVERLARMQQTSDTRMQRQVEELEGQVRAAEKARHEKARSDLIATHISRQQQLKWKADAHKQEAREQTHFAEQLGSLNARLRDEEMAKAQHERKERERLDDYLFDQMARRQAGELSDRQAEVQEAEHISQFLQVSGARHSKRARARDLAVCGTRHSKIRGGRETRAAERCCQHAICWSMRVPGYPDRRGRCPPRTVSTTVRVPPFCGAQDEEAIFQQYAKMCVAELKDEAKTTVPIELLLSKKESLFG